VCSPGQCGFLWAHHASGTGRWHLGLRHNHEHPSSTRSSTSSSCWWAALPLVCATPRLLGHAPACHPVGKSGITIVWVGRWRTPTTLVRAALPMNSTTPFFLWNRPARLPVGEAVLAVVWVSWCWRCCWLATDVVDPAAPLLLCSVPSKVLPHGTIVWINRSSWGRWRDKDWGWPHNRWGRWRPRRRWRGRRCGWWRGKRSRRLCENRCRQRCGRNSGRRTTSTHRGTAVILLRLGPHILDQLSIPHAHACIPHACFAIVWQRSGQARQEP